MRLTPALILLFVMAFAGACAKRSHSNAPNTIIASNNSGVTAAAPSQRININTASAKELEQLPGIGKGLAARIIEHREKYGPFRRPEHLIMVRGISDHRFRALRDWITVE